MDLDAGTCTISDLGEWQNFGVREDDTYVGIDYIGSKLFDYGVRVNEYIRRDGM